MSINIIILNNIKYLLSIYIIYSKYYIDNVKEINKLMK